MTKLIASPAPLFILRGGGRTDALAPIKMWKRVHSTHPDPDGFLFRKMTNMRKIDAKKGLHRVLTYGLYQGRMPS